MGRLKDKLPITSRTFYWASLANAGIIPLAGFWSKDEILAAAFAGHHYLLWVLGSAGAFMTAFYMFRLYYTVFEGKDNVDHHVAHHVHESPPAMAYPLIILGIGSLVVGALFGFPPDHGLYHRLVEPVFAAAGTEVHAIGLGTTVGLAAVATLIAALGIWGLARVWYKSGESTAPAQAAERFRALYALLLDKYRVDEFYNAVFVDFGKWLCARFWTVDAKGVDGTVNGASALTVFLSYVSAKFDFRGVDGLVNAIADLIQGGSRTFRRIQTGVLQNYLLAMAMGIFVIVSLFYFF
jgi:NADH-quinone oxidoreductase subunit L